MSKKKEERKYDGIYSSKYAYEDRIKVTKEEKANYKPNYLKRAALIGIATLLISIPVGKHIYNINKDSNNLEQSTIINQNKTIASIDIDGITLEIASPELQYIDGNLCYVAPTGYIYDGYNCYRLTCQGEAPIGYTKGNNNTLYQVDTEMKYHAPEGYILVGAKAVNVIDPTIIEENGKTRYELPEGYILVNKIGIKIIDAEPIKEKGL